MRRILIIIITMLAAWLAPAAAAWASAPTVVLSAPATGALLRGGQPRFSGTVSGFHAGGQVTIKLYGGSEASGTPLQMLQADESSGHFSATAFGLADGTYTAQAVAGDSSGDRGMSQAVTFQLFNGQPQLTLSLPPAIVATAAPTFTGSALTAPGDSGTAYLVIYAAHNTNATPLAVLAGPVGVGGVVSIQVQPALPAGTYTAVLSQIMPGGVAFSPGVGFSITRAGAGVTLTSPAPGASGPQTGVAGAISISGSGRLRVRLSCPGRTGTCQGDVLIVTRRAFQPEPGGPNGPLALMFARFSVAANRPQILTQQLTPGQLRVLRRAGPTQLRVTVAYPVAGHLTESTHLSAAVTVSR